MTPEDIKPVVDNFMHETQCIHDLRIAFHYFRCVPNSFFLVGERNGDFVGSHILITWSPNVSYTGYIFVAEKYRSFGYGRKFLTYIESQLNKSVITTGDLLLGPVRSMYRRINATEQFLTNVCVGSPRNHLHQVSCRLSTPFAVLPVGEITVYQLYTYTYINLHIPMHAYMCTSTYTELHAHIHAHPHTLTHTHTHIHTHTHTHTHTRAHTHAHTQIIKFIHISQINISSIQYSDM